jgi:hypothetical protein
MIAVIVDEEDTTGFLHSCSTMIRVYEETK